MEETFDFSGIGENTGREAFGAHKSKEAEKEIKTGFGEEASEHREYQGWGGIVTDKVVR